MYRKKKKYNRTVLNFRIFNIDFLVIDELNDKIIKYIKDFNNLGVKNYTQYTHTDTHIPTHIYTQTHICHMYMCTHVHIMHDIYDLHSMCHFTLYLTTRK